MRVPLFALIFCALAAGASADELPRTITVTGESQISVAPDMATVTLGATTETKTAREALSVNSAQVAAVIERLKAAGIESRDIQTSGLSLGPRYDYRDGQPPVVAGFVASNSVTARVRALGDLGTLLDAVAGDDAANTLGGLVFGLQDDDAVTDQARRAAVADAKHRAELYADAAGVALGPVLSISESGNVVGPMPMAMAEASFAKGASVPVEGGEINVAATVTIVYAIVE